MAAPRRGPYSPFPETSVPSARCRPVGGVSPIMDGPEPRELGEPYWSGTGGVRIALCRVYDDVGLLSDELKQPSQEGPMGVRCQRSSRG